MLEVSNFVFKLPIRNEKSMKQEYSTTSEPAVPSLGEIGVWAMSLVQLHQRLAPHFARPEVRAHALLYLQAILSEIPRKNGWQIAEFARQARPYGMQRLLSRAVWDEEAVRDELRTLVCQTLSPPPLVPAVADAEPLYPVLVIDESGFPKRGHHSAGVAPQYCGVTGRVENCQVGVFLSFVTALGHALIDRELYLPDEWCDDLPRRRAAHIPDAVTFATKPDLGKRMLHRAQAAGLPFRWVVADTVYGHSTDLRAWLEEQNCAYALAVPAIEVVTASTPSGCRPLDVASLARHHLRERDWQRLSASQGTKGPRLFDWARLPLLSQGATDGRHWLVVRRCLDEPQELAYYLVFAPPATPLSTLIQAIGARWHIEEDLQVAKDLGLDHHEGRSSGGWYRHITLVLLAAAFLLRLALAQPLPDPPLIALTSSEIRHLLARLLLHAPTAVPFVCQWSRFRRTHQYWAGSYHRRRREKALAASPGG